jgi:AraC-like DNA-binding protein
LRTNGAAFISTQVISGEYYYLNLTPPGDPRDVVICGGREQCAPAYRIERSDFAYHAIEFVADGRGALAMGGATYTLKPGMLFSYGPGVPHTIGSDPASPLLKYFVDFAGGDLAALLRRTVFARGVPLYASRPFRIRDILETLMTTGNTPSRHRDALCTLLLRQLILTIDDTAMDPESAASPAWHTYLRCREHIERHVLRIATVRDAARQCFVDPAYLARLFKRFAEESPLQLLNRLKMNRAAELLGNRDLLVKEAAEAVGFADPYHFSRVFKRVYGIPPETFSRTARRHGMPGTSV